MFSSPFPFGLVKKNVVVGFCLFDFLLVCFVPP